MPAHPCRHGQHCPSGSGASLSRLRLTLCGGPDSADLRMSRSATGVERRPQPNQFAACQAKQISFTSIVLSRLNLRSERFSLSKISTAEKRSCCKSRCAEKSTPGGIHMFGAMAAAIVGGMMTFAYLALLQDVLLGIILAPFGGSLLAFLLCAFRVTAPRRAQPPATAWPKAFR
jgi:hypothetical protein